MLASRFINFQKLPVITVNASFKSSSTCLRPYNPRKCSFLACLDVCRRKIDNRVFNQINIAIDCERSATRWGRINLHDNYSLRSFYGRKNHQKLCGNGAIVLQLTCKIGDFNPKQPENSRTTACKLGIRKPMNENCHQKSIFFQLF